jgi:tRNA threonylcarbamoyl adenosine modification protein (Sua5/YciO/YrdC/YwlC family)
MLSRVGSHADTAPPGARNPVPARRAGAQIMLHIAASSCSTALLTTTSQRTAQPLMMAKGSKSKKQEMDYTILESDGSDAWRAESAVTCIRKGGVGVIPTDTGYSFVTSVSSKQGVNRILRLKGEGTGRKPLSLLCQDLATVQEYALGIDKPKYKMLKAHLPGPYTFILRASPALPKMVYHDGKRQWKRSEIGLRIPGDLVCSSLLEQLDEPLLCSTVPLLDDDEEDEYVAYNPEVAPFCEVAEMGDAWCQQVDFVLDAGPRPSDGSTVLDIREDEPVLLRQGIGPVIDG